jgi:hypothetical protein
MNQGSYPTIHSLLSSNRSTPTTPCHQEGGYNRSARVRTTVYISVLGFNSHHSTSKSTPIPLEPGTNTSRPRIQIVPSHTKRLRQSLTLSSESPHSSHFTLNLPTLISYTQLHSFLPVLIPIRNTPRLASLSSIELSNLPRPQLFSPTPLPKTPEVM